MLAALKQNKTRMRTARGYSIPAPVGGLNAVDEFADMDPRDALILDNFFPDAYNVVLRKGFSSWATGIGAHSIETLMTWAGPTSSKMFAAANGKIFDVTTAGSVSSAVVSSLGSNRWQTTNFSTSGGNFLVLCNGVDAVRNYDGASWTSPSIGSVTSSTLISVCPFKSRLWFVKKDTRDAWYLPAASVAGTAVKFPLGAFFAFGGKLLAIGTLSSDAGITPDDYICFISSVGEVLVYAGTDPSSSSTFALVGRYKTGIPIGNRPLLSFGGDLIIITSDGAVSMARTMKVDRTQDQKAAITYKIQTLFNRAAQNYSANFGWQAILYPKGNWALFNVPTSTTAFEQYVMNAITGSWCHFNNMNGSCWGVLDNNIYFGGTNGTVYKADTGYTDNMGPITGNIKTAWNYLNSRGTNKFITMIRPILQSSGSPSVLMAVNTDFGNLAPTGAISVTPPSGSLWGPAKWGSGTWAGNSNITANWFSGGAIGYCISLRINVVAQGQSFSINSFDLQGEIGGAL